ncbi:MAG TPA: MBL fold metallo-hydrolase [Candidatus Lokiarchaeia archaeon]|nr:MBL fold metallo-hydrolase [Candidatus Lokiarchaeia archaeon]
MGEDYLIFLGNGGGRFSAVTQYNPTGGFQLVVDNSYRIHVDPGPSTATYLKQLGIDPESIRAILITHHHFDHFHDAVVLIEGMRTGPDKTTNGVLATTPKAISRIPEYHQHFLKQIFPILAGDTCALPGPVKIQVDATRADHVSAGEGQAMGFIVSAKNWKIGITGDTIIYPEFAETYASVDVLVAYLRGPDNAASQSHMCTDDLIPAVRQMADYGHLRAVILTHFGRRIASPKVPDRSLEQAAKIEAATGVETLPASLGFRYDV